jgi:transcriptional regulator with XRE-family HTH domain
MTDRRQFLATFRARLDEIVRQSGTTRSAFAENSAIDRSTLSQLMSPANRRLPRLETIVTIAEAQQVSIDWLLGLTNAGPMQAEVVREETAFAPGGRAESDERLLAWYQEAVGYKVRYVPTTLPDLLKTPDVFAFELGDYVTTTPGQSRAAAASHLEWARRPGTEIEVCSSIQSVQSFARGEGIWADLSADVRVKQLDRMIDLTHELYPSFRWFLFDGLQRYASPVTIFGPLRAALYLGQQYLVLSSAEHVRTLSTHFDDLIRGAVVQPPDVPDTLARLRREVLGS